MDLLPDLVGLNRSPLDAAWREWLAGDLVAQPYAIAFSGGADSTALLVQAVGMARISAQSRPVVALHIHHGLQPAADDFVTHCESICVALDRQFPTRLHVEHITVALDKGDSIEAKAREARYAALAAVALARGIHTVLLAQHADDQVETVLLALTRGAGLAGLSGMAPNFERDGVQFGRPMLDVAARDLRDWLNAARIPYLQDPSNDDQRFTRNRLRHSVVPGLQAAFPAYRTTFGRSAGLAFQAQQLLVEVAEQDLASIGSPPAIKSLQSLSKLRQTNVLRHWLRSAAQTTPSQAQMSALLSQIDACATRGHQIELKVGRGFVVRDQSVLRFRG